MKKYYDHKNLQFKKLNFKINKRMTRPKRLRIYETFILERISRGEDFYCLPVIQIIYAVRSLLNCGFIKRKYDDFCLTGKGKYYLNNVRNVIWKESTKL